MPVSESDFTVPPGDLGGRKVLFIAYFFPPTVSTGVPGSQRTVKFLRNLSNGECHVLTVPDTVSEPDNALSHLTLPINGETIHRIAPWDLFKALLALRGWLKALIQKPAPGSSLQEPATSSSTFKTADSSPDRRSAFQKLKDFVYDLCYFPDQAGPWILPAARYGKQLVREQNIDVIFATGSPWSGLITGYLISKATGKPLILDFRDPWMDNPFHQSKGGLLDSWSRKLERKVVHHAAAISLNTEPLLQEFLQRYPEQEPEKFFTMPNGFDPSDFGGIEIKNNRGVSDELLLCHAGFLYGVRDPAALLDAIRVVNRQLTKTGAVTRVCFRQIGDVQLNYKLEERFGDLLDSGHLQLVAPMAYQQCLAALTTADIVVNVQPGTRSQIPSKLYDYLALQRPILHLTPPDGALGQLVHKYQLGIQIDFTDNDQLVQYLYDALSNYHKWRESQYLYEHADLFSIHSVTESLVKTVRAVTREL